MQGHSSRRNTHKDYRLRLGRALIDNFTSRQRHAPIFKCKKGGVSSVPEELRFTDVGKHMPQLGKYRRCRFCSTRAKEQRSKFFAGYALLPYVLLHVLSDFTHRHLARLNSKFL